MCTAISLRGNHHVFGRTLDLERSYGEVVAITPQNMPLHFLHAGVWEEHFALLGVACVRDGVALYFDAINEAGLGMAALNFPVSAVYRAPRSGGKNVASFELIPYVLARSRSVADAKRLLRDVCITNEAFSRELPPSPLHWMVADQHAAMVVESVAEGVMLYDDPFAVLTNEPSFPHHAARMSEVLHLSPTPVSAVPFGDAMVSPLSRGTGAVGLPGDFSSPSRFLRASFAAAYTESGASEREEVARFFHVADTVSVPCGVVRAEDGASVRTVYTACGCTDTLTYYTATYERRALHAVSLVGIPRSERALLTFSL